MRRFCRWLSSKIGIRRGQTTSEYVIIVGLVAIGSIAVIILFGNQIRALFGGSTKKLAGQTGVTVNDYGDQTDAKVEKNLSNFTGD